MVSANKQNHSLPKPSKSGNPKNPSTASGNADENPPSVPGSPISIAGADHDTALESSAFLSRQELLLRRSRRAKQLSRLYRSHYWALAEELRLMYRQYYWEFGVSPFRHDDSALGEAGEDSGPHHPDDRPVGDCGVSSRCAFAGCKSKAMALTSYCHQHILSDSKQKLYKACSYVIKSAHTGPVICGKPVLRAAVPSLCTVHFQRAQRHVSQALKKAGFNTASSSKPAPKFHVIIAEYIRKIQAKRREAQRITIENHMVKEERTT